MEYGRFIEEVRANVERLCGGEYETRLQEVTKNNGRVFTGMTFTKRGERGNCGPTVYFESYYEMHREGAMSAERAARDMLGMVTGYEGEWTEVTSLAAGLGDFENVKGRVNYRLVDYGSNKEFLKNAPFVPFCDLAVVFYIYLGENGHGSLTAQIHNEHMRAWKTDVDTLYRLARENTPRTFPPEVRSMKDVMKQIARDRMGYDIDDDLFEEVLGSGQMTPLYVLTNRTGVNGASVVLYDGVLRDLAERLGSDLVILPSSIHEALAIPYEDHLDAAELEWMVRDINRKEVKPEDVLSDNVYRYSRATDEIGVMSANGPDCGEREADLEIRDGKAAPAGAD